MSSHVVLELRTSRSAEHKPEVAAQLFSTLPSIQQGFLPSILGKNEHLSFEILVQNQTIYFLCFTPTRLQEYVTSIIQASYPEVLVTPLEGDPASALIPPTLETPATTTFGSLKLKHSQFLSLKTYADFKDTDPLAPVLATLSKAGPLDQILIQFVVHPEEHERWKTSGFSLLKTGEGEKEHPQKKLMEKKLSSRGHKTAIKVVVTSESKDRAKLLLETVSSAFQSISQGEGNSLVLTKPWVLKKQFLQGVLERSFDRAPSYHLSLEELATLYHLPGEKTAHINNIAWGKHLLGEPPETLPVVTSGMPEAEKKEINPFAKVHYKNQEMVYGIRRNDRRRHMYVIGKTGTGKSTLLANMAINDLKRDEGICVIDPHGDLVETLLDYIPSHRINDVVYFDPADPERTVQINLFEGENLVHRELIASGIVSIFYKLYGYSWGPRLEHILRNSLLTLLKAPQSRLSDIVDLLTDNEYRKEVIDNLDDQILQNFWINDFNKMQDRQRSEAVAPILNKVGQFVSSPLVRNVVNAHKSSFSLEQIMDEGKILLVNLSQGKLGEDNATLLGAMLITKIQLAAMARVHTKEESRRDFYLYVDEFQNFATDSFIKILSEARKYRLNLILANQYIAQIPEEVQKAIFGNCGSIANFILGADDAKVFSAQYANTYSDEDLVSLSRHQIINRISIDNIMSKPFPAQTLGLATSNNKNRDKVIKESRERYAKKKEVEKIATRKEVREKMRAERKAEGGDEMSDSQIDQMLDPNPPEEKPNYRGGGSRGGGGSGGGNYGGGGYKGGQSEYRPLPSPVKLPPDPNRPKPKVVFRKAGEPTPKPKKVAVQTTTNQDTKPIVKIETKKPVEVAKKTTSSSNTALRKLLTGASVARAQKASPSTPTTAKPTPTAAPVREAIKPTPLPKNNPFDR